MGRPCYCIQTTTVYLKEYNQNTNNKKRMPTS